MADKNMPSWEKDFLAFSSGESIAIPESARAAIFAPVKRDFHPSGLVIFCKSAAIHAVVGALTLLFCPQFGIAITSNRGLMPFLMQYGNSACMLGCGAFFTGISLLIISLALRPEEVRALRERQVLQLSFLATLSLGAFLFVGGEVILSFALIWALGAILGGAFTLELGWLFRRRKIQRSFA